jgi:predicted nuclease of restriction endonuclease-like (RecB) superfamily
LELGRGFAFVGSQVQLEVDGQPFYIDLLFYHVRLHCYFVIELKNGAFKPEYAGKLSFYLSAVDGTMRTPVDGPSIGVLLCESRSGPIVEYTLQNIVQPIGVSTYRVTCELPEPLQTEVPSIEDLQEVVEKLRKELNEGPPGARDGCGSRDRGVRLKDQPTREWYVKAAVEHGWSRNVLVHHISIQLQERQGKALTNFSRTLPPEDSDLAEQILKESSGFRFDSRLYLGCAG